MPRLSLDISNGFYESFSEQYANLICNNLRVVVPQGPAYSPTALRATDGIDEFVESGYKTSRGAIEVDDVAYFVQGNQFLSVSSGGTVTTYGTITGTGRVSMDNSQSYIWIVVPGGNAYYFNIGTSTLTTVNTSTDPNWSGPANSVVFKDSFFFFTTDTTVFNSNLDGISFTPTDYGTAEVDPDKIWTGINSNGQYYALGSRTIQPYQTVGGAGFPLSPIVQGTVERGLAARFAVTKADNTFFFMGGGDQQEVAVWRFVGNDAIKISTDPIDNYIQGLTDAQIQDGFMFSYQLDGEEYVVLTFAPRTFVYQIEASKRKGRPVWHERSTSSSRWRVNTVVRAHNKIYVGDDDTDKIGVLNASTPTEYGDTVFREFSTQPFNIEGYAGFCSSYELVMQTGVGNSSSTNPVVSHSFSDDGINFSQLYTREVGAVGEYSKRVVWRRMGRFERDRVLKFSINEPCTVVFFRIEAEVTRGS